MPKQQKAIDFLEAGEETRSFKEWEYIRVDDKQKIVTADPKGALVQGDVGQWKCRTCGGTFFSNGNPPLECGCCDRQTHCDPVSPLYLDEPWIPYNEPRVISKHELLPNETSGFLRRYLILPRKEDYEIMTWWILASYRQRDFWTFPYLQFIAPVRSGKTTALQLINLLAYRCVNAIAVTPAALSRLIEQYGCVVCLDQAENKFNMKTERGQELDDIFMGGYKRGEKHIVSDKDDPEKIIIRHEFGPKAMASTKTFDEALEDRSIVFHLREGIPEKEDITEDTLKEAQEIRSTLLYFSLYPKKLPVVDVDLHGRIREKYSPLIQVCSYFEEDTTTIYDHARKTEEKQGEEAILTQEHDILQVICDAQSTLDEQHLVMISDITTKTGFTPQVVGWKLKNINIPRKKSRDGAYISLEDPEVQDELKTLYKKYHVKSTH